MMNVIVYPNIETSGLNVLIPNVECGLTIEQIIEKDVPFGLPSKTIAFDGFDKIDLMKWVDVFPDWSPVE